MFQYIFCHRTYVSLKLNKILRCMPEVSNTVTDVLEGQLNIFAISVLDKHTHVFGLMFQILTLAVLTFK